MFPKLPPRRQLAIDPESNVLIGLKEILRYIRQRHPATLYKWVEIYGFPAIKLPDGQWMTTITSIDQWIFLAASADLRNRNVARTQQSRISTSVRRLIAKAKGLKVDPGAIRQAQESHIDALIAMGEAPSVPGQLLDIPGARDG